MARRKDLTGQRFGKLVAIRPTDERRHEGVVWECRCECGNTAFVSVNHLQNGHTQSCGCIRAIDLTGQHFGRLTAVRKTDERRGTSVVWECKCDCGNTTYVTGANLRRGNVTSCGCTRSIDLTGQHFGLLTAVRKTDKRQGSSVIWECKCDCGNVAFVPAYYLRCGRVQSCGCMRYKRKSKEP